MFLHRYLQHVWLNVAGFREVQIWIYALSHPARIFNLVYVDIPWLNDTGSLVLF